MIMTIITYGAVVLGALLVAAIIGILGFVAFGMIVQIKIYRLEGDVTEPLPVASKARPAVHDAVPSPVTAPL